MPSAERIAAPEIHAALDKLAARIARAHKNTERLAVLGVANGGLEIARRLTERLSALLKREIPQGVIDISFYRDDIGSRPIPKVFTPTDVPGEIDESTFILADDVLQSGRTIRAALEELFSQGRPSRVELAVLVDRGGRTLPIEPHHVGLTINATKDSDVKVLLDARNPKRDEIRILPPKKR